VNGGTGGPGHHDGVVACGQIVRDVQQQDGHERRRAASVVEGSGHAFRNRHAQGHVSTEAVDGFHEHGGRHGPRDAGGQHNPGVKGPDGEVGAVVYLKGDVHAVGGGAVRGGDAQHVIAAVHRGGVDDDAARFAHGKRGRLVGHARR